MLPSGVGQGLGESMLRCLAFTAFPIGQTSERRPYPRTVRVSTTQLHPPLVAYLATLAISLRSTMQPTSSQTSYRRLDGVFEAWLDADEMDTLRPSSVSVSDTTSENSVCGESDLETDLAAQYFTFQVSTEAP